jgi:integrase
LVNQPVELSAAPKTNGDTENASICGDILILAHSGIRVGEARHLRWRDVSSTKTLGGQKRLLFTVRGKTGEREVVCNEIDFKTFGAKRPKR